MTTLDTPRTRAYVSGSRTQGYFLQLPNGLPLATRAEFATLHGTFYTRYRAAQLLANAVNADARKQRSE